MTPLDKVPRIPKDTSLITGSAADTVIKCFTGKASVPHTFKKSFSWLLVPALCALVVNVQITNLVLCHTVYTWLLLPSVPECLEDSNWFLSTTVPPVFGTVVLNWG